MASTHFLYWTVSMKTGPKVFPAYRRGGGATTEPLRTSVTLVQAWIRITWGVIVYDVFCTVVGSEGNV